MTAAEGGREMGESDTPRADARVDKHREDYEAGKASLGHQYCELADLTRKLERELAALRSQPRAGADGWQLVKTDAVAWMMRHYPTLCDKSGLSAPQPPVEREGWISVGERLPIIEESVLIWSDTNDFCNPSIGNLSNVFGWVDEREMVHPEGWPSTKDVTHWQPLPKAPK